MNCIFCKILNQEIPSTTLYEDDQVIVIKDINPLAPVHLLVISKKHIDSLQAAKDEDQALLGHILLVARRLARELGLAELGYRVVNNIGDDGGQAVKHLHFHILGGAKLGGFGI